MNKFIYSFVLQRLRQAGLIAIILSLVFLAIDFNFLFQYFFGFLLSCANFILLSLGINMMVGLRYKSIRLIQFLFFTLRYLMVAYLIVEVIKDRAFNPFIIIIGFLTLNLSIKIFAFKEHFQAKKEG